MFSVFQVFSISNSFQIPKIYSNQIKSFPLTLPEPNKSFYIFSRTVQIRNGSADSNKAALSASADFKRRIPPSPLLQQQQSGRSASPFKNYSIYFPGSRNFILTLSKTHWIGNWTSAKNKKEEKRTRSSRGYFSVLFYYFLPWDCHCHL